MNLMDITLPYQRKFIQNPSKRKLWLSSRQIGKSFACGMIAVYKALSRRNGLSLCISTGSRSASELLKKCALFAEAIHILEPSINYSASSDSIKFSNGSRVISLPSGNPSALRGWSAQCIIIDEGAFIDSPEDVWAAITPTLLRDPNAEMILVTTPAGTVGWFYKLYQMAISSPDWYVQTTTIYDAVEQGLKVDIEELKKTIADPIVWEQEFCCKFSQEYGAMLDLDLLEFADPPEDTAAHFVGVDIGATNDRTAIVDIIQRKNNHFFVNDIVMLHKSDYQTQLKVIQDLYKKWHWSGGYVDAVGIGGPMAEFIGKQVSAKIKPFQWTVASKTPAYEHTRSLIFDHRLSFAKHL